MRRAVQTDRRGEDGHAAKLRMIDLAQRAALVEMRVGHHLIDLLDDTAEDIVGGEIVHDLLTGLRAGPFGDDMIDGLLMLAAASQLRETWIFAKLRMTNQRT